MCPSILKLYVICMSTSDFSCNCASLNIMFLFFFHTFYDSLKFLPLFLALDLLKNCEMYKIFYSYSRFYIIPY